ncbi:MAG: hypothetical protein GQ534_07400 [Candidatus Delongbacteria bacterium]|nr:hypothetical protein [Candidatus Delongbacteria bacterium]
MIKLKQTLYITAFIAFISVFFTWFKCDSFFVKMNISWWELFKDLSWWKAALLFIYTYFPIYSVYKISKNRLLTLPFISLMILGISGLFKDETFADMMSDLFINVTGMEVNLAFGFYLHFSALLIHCIAIYFYNKKTVS